MYQQEFSAAPTSGVKPRPVSCYNCGAFEHYVVACPESTRAIPAGLAAARAAQASQAVQTSAVGETGQASYANRPQKRQKTGAIVTKYPVPANGPIVTQYALPPSQAPQYGVANQGYYGPSLTQPYQQQAQSQLYVPDTQQQGMHFSSYGSQPSHGNPHPYARPPMSSGYQGYGPPVPFIQQPYGQQPAQVLSQSYAYQAPHGTPYQDGAYPTVQAPQHYAYEPQVQYSQQQMAGVSQQNYSPYQDQPYLQGQSPQQYLPYHGPSPAQTAYGQSPQPYHQQHNQNWSSPSPAASAYSAPAYQQGFAQQQPPYQNRYQNQQYQHSRYQHTHPRQQSYVQSSAVQPPRLDMVQQGSAASNDLQQQPSHPEKAASDITVQDGVPTPSTQQPVAQETAEESDFEWEDENVFVEDVHQPADPIARPLPTVFDEEPIPPPAYDAMGIISKYVRPNNKEIYVRDIRSSLHWAIIKPDPIFKIIDHNSPLIPLDEVNGWIQQRQDVNEIATVVLQDEDQISPFTRKRAWSEEQEDEVKQHCHETSLDSENIEVHQPSPMSPLVLQTQNRVTVDRAGTPSLDRSSTPTLGRSGTPSFGADDDVWAPQPGEGQISTSPTEDPNEALLASLGVTGTPKPVTQNLSIIQSGEGYKEDSVQDHHGPHPSRQDSGYVSARGSYSNGSTGVSDHNTMHGDYRQSYDGSKPPPPPPPPLHLRKQVDGSFDSPSSDGSARVPAGGAASYDAQNGAHQASSPLTPTSAESATLDGPFVHERKNIKKPASLRQEDDVTPKFKRRQPRVADAYSRRW